jgi:hypothetical protein
LTVTPSEWWLPGGAARKRPVPVFVFFPGVRDPAAGFQRANTDASLRGFRWVFANTEHDISGIHICNYLKNKAFMGYPQVWKSLCVTLTAEKFGFPGSGRMNGSMVEGFRVFRPARPREFFSR